MFSATQKSENDLPGSANNATLIERFWKACKVTVKLATDGSEETGIVKSFGFRDNREKPINV